MPPAQVSRLDRFVEQRRARWRRLDDLQTRAAGDVRSISGEEILELGTLYRGATADLATARRDFPDADVTRYLNALVARAHPVIYGDAPSGFMQLVNLFRYGFPAAYRQILPYTALAFALFAGSALVAAGLVAVQPHLADTLLPGEAADLRSIMAQHHLWMKSATANHSVAANFIMLNNIKVAMLAFAGGMLAGLGAVYVLTLNGINLGAVAAMVAQYHLSLGLWSFVVPHGVIELSVIWMAGGAGWRIGDAILRPGLVPRSVALERAARQAGVVLLGCVPLLVVAGTIEGFLSPSDLPPALKIAFGAVAGIILYAYLLLSRPGRRRDDAYAFEDVLRDERPAAG